MKYLFLLFPIILVSNFLTPYSSNFIEEKFEKFDLIYAEEHSKYRDYIAKEVSKTVDIYEKSFGFKLRNRLKVILASSRDQVTNGYATPVYTNKIVLFNGGSSGIDYFSSPFWIDNLIRHELAHTFQLNAQKSKFSQVANTIFGNSLEVPVIQVFPNLLLPDGLLEGNAVLNESLFGMGGRLYNGSLKALFLTTLPKLDETRFVNNHLEFPFMEEKYIAGSFFNLYLYNIYGIQKVNRFFLSHSKGFIPAETLFINKSFQTYFGKSFTILFQEFIDLWKSSLEEFSIQKGVEIGFTERYFSLTRDLENIYLTSSNRDSKPKTETYSKIGGSLSDEVYFGTGGKMFKIGDSFVEAKNGNSDSQEIKFGLWKDGKIIEESKGKVFFDHLKDSWLYFDTDASFKTPNLYKDGNFIDEITSSPLFDKESNIYYFKQNRDIRTLSKNGKPLFSFQGFYSKIVDIDGEKIYFIANSDLGSTLYLFQNGRIFRVMQGDNIFDGKLINSENIILTTVKSDGYHYLKVEIPKKLEESKIYFQNIGDEFIFSDSNLEVSQNRKEYNSILKLSFVELLLSYGTNGINFHQISFQDPIGYNLLTLGFLDLGYSEEYRFGYSNSRYWINYGFSGEFLEYQNNHQTKFSSFLHFQLSKMENFATSLTVQTIFIEDYFSDNFRLEEYRGNYIESFQFVAGYGVGESESYGNSIYSQESIFFQPIYKYLDESNFLGLYFEYGRKISDYTFFGSSYKGVVNLEQKENLYIENILDVDDLGDISLEGLHDSLLPSRSLHKFSTVISQIINLPIYFFKFPLSLRREAIFVRYDHILEDRKDDLRYVNETVFGLSFELLAMHRFPVPMTFKYIDNSISGGSFKFITEFGF